MSRKQFKSPEELVDLESKFLDNYEKMNSFIKFFNRVQEMLTSNHNIKVLEINLSRFLPETTEVLPFSFIISISSREYLFFVINKKQPKLNINELVEYKKLFNENLNQIGIIVVWDDKNLSSLLLKDEDLSAPAEIIIENIIDNLLPLEDLLEKEINRKDLLGKTVKTPVIDIQERKALNLSKEFEKLINEALSKYKSKKFRGVKKDIMMQINEKEINMIIDFFTDYLLDKYSRKDIKKKFKKIGENVK